MRSLSTHRRPVRRIAIGTVTLTLVGIGSVLALGASWAPNRAAANPIAMTQPSAVSLGDDSVRFDGDLLSGFQTEQASDALSLSSVNGDKVQAPGAVCCTASGGSCILQGGSKCPSGSTQRPCPCLEPI